VKTPPVDEGEIIGLAAARRNLSTLVRRIVEIGRPVRICHRGRIAAETPAAAPADMAARCLRVRAMIAAHGQ
jgi:antitoxin (DNA-binding transcriptional repressor) of toxin-antitoxin stability system